MKVSQIPYERYTIEQGRSQFEKFKIGAKNAKNVNELINAREYALKMMRDYSTAAALANCRFTLNTSDEFYKSEMDYYDSNGPMFSQLFTEYADIMLSSPFKNEAEKILNPQIFKKLDYQKKSFAPCITEESQQENMLVTEYSQFMSSMVFDFDNTQLPLSVLRGYLENEDRELHL